MLPRHEGTRKPPRQHEHLGRLAIRVLTHNVTILAAITAVLLGVITNVSLGEDNPKPPPAAAVMSTFEVANLLQRAKMSPAVAAGIANAKRRAYEAQRKGKKKSASGASAGTGEVSQGFRTKPGDSIPGAPSGGGNTSLSQNQAIGRQLNAAKGWGSCWSSLLALWNKESRWNERAQNPSSGAYGIPQSLPGDKMASAGSDWRTNARTQIVWGLGYIDARYGTPCQAWSHSQSVGWY
jgi:hypothetical protein